MYINCIFILNRVHKLKTSTQGWKKEIYRRYFGSWIKIRANVVNTNLLVVSNKLTAKRKSKNQNQKGRKKKRKEKERKREKKKTTK